MSKKSINSFIIVQVNSVCLRGKIYNKQDIIIDLLLITAWKWEWEWGLGWGWGWDWNWGWGWSWAWYRSKNLFDSKNSAHWYVCIGCSSYHARLLFWYTFWTTLFNYSLKIKIKMTPILRYCMSKTKKIVAERRLGLRPGWAGAAVVIGI